MWHLTLKPGKKHTVYSMSSRIYVTMIELKTATNCSDIHTVYIKTEDSLFWHLSESTGCKRVFLDLVYGPRTIIEMFTLGPDEIIVHGHFNNYVSGVLSIVDSDNTIDKFPIVSIESARTETMGSGLNE